MAEVEMIGKYKVEGLIAQGGMGAVYKAIHPSLKRQVVIKKLAMRGSSIAKERFKKEAQILLDMQSPYIVHLFDYFTEGSYRYIVEEFVDGLALDKLIKKQTALSPQVALLVLQDACFALKFAHSKGVVHRDIKPGNILISKRAEVKLADFGIASDEHEADEFKTKEGVMLGTPAYMPPEQFENSSAVDQRADIYALGVMLYEMVTGSKPYPGDMSEETFSKVRHMKYISPRKIDKNIPRVICKLIHKMLKPKAKNRFQSVTPIIKIIKRYLKKYDTHEIRVELAKMVISQKPLEQKVFEKKKNIWKTLLLVAFFACVACGLVYYLWTSGFIYKTILRKWWTPTVVTMKMPQTTAPASDISARAIFFKVEEQIEDINDSERVFIEGTPKNSGITAERPSSTTKDYVTKPIYLRHGRYRVKVVVGSYVWWRSFVVDQKEQILSLDFLRKESRPITFRMTARDAKTGENLTKNAKFFVLYNNKWITFDKLPKDKFLSSNVWKFKATLDGYEDEIYSLLIDWYQDSVSVDAELFPKE